MTQMLLQMNNISKSFPGVQVLKDVNFSVRKGSILALVGENGAGKSTLMKIIAGIHQKDAGTFTFDGEEVNALTPAHSQKIGISVIHQELNLVPNMSVAENIFMGQEKTSYAFLLNKKETNREAERLLQLVGLNIDPNILVQELSIAQRQMIEIAKALSINAKLIVMDEPTSSLTEREVKILMDIMTRLKSQGVSIIFISHKLGEIFHITDHITVMRDGVTIDTLDTDKCTEEMLIRMMIGREIKDVFARETVELGETILEVKGLSSGNTIKDASFSLRKGEILGFSGLVGAGRSELMRAVFGIDRFDQGEIFVEGKKVTITRPEDAISLGIGLVPEDRKLQGLILGMGVRENTTISSLEKVSAFGFINKGSERTVTREFIDKLAVKTPHQEQHVVNLSGGNQQKVVISKWLAIKPKILILDEPTRGVDIGAKKEIYALMNQLTRQGIAIIMVSSELPEVLGMSDRILVMHEGAIKGELSRAEATEENIMTVAFGNV